MRRGPWLRRECADCGALGGCRRRHFDAEHLREISAYWNGNAASSLPRLDPLLKLSYSHWKVGQYQTIAGYEEVRQGNCLFAGEHTSIDFQGFMEGGALSGQRAAKEILADLK